MKILENGGSRSSIKSKSGHMKITEKVVLNFKKRTWDKFKNKYHALRQPKIQNGNVNCKLKIALVCTFIILFQILNRTINSS